ncbi:MAG TPA: DUF2382 domain-containing protein [Galbitalea sp.]
MIDAAAVRNLPGAPVQGPEGEKIGTVAQVFVDHVNAKPSWVTIHTGLFGRQESFIPLEQANFDGETLQVGFEKSVIRDAPRVDADGALSPADETALFEYYGMTGAAPSEGPDAGEPDAGGPDEGRSATESDALRLRKYVVTDVETIAVPVRHEEVRIEPERHKNAHVADAEVDARPGARNGIAARDESVAGTVPREQDAERRTQIPDVMGGSDDVDRG